MNRLSNSRIWCSWIATILLTFLCHSLGAQDYISTIRYLTDKDGFSSNKVYAIHKDSRGFMWIGTKNGLNLFDGTAFTIYSPSSQNGMTISTIHEIFEDEESYLWLLKKNSNYEHAYKRPEINLLNIYTGEITTPQKRFGEKFPLKNSAFHFLKKIAKNKFYE